MNSLRRIKKPRGFTLIELVVTILLVAILAVFVAPKFLTQSGYSAYTLQDEFISELRKAQMMALNNTDRCYRVNVTSSGYHTQHFASRNNSNICQGTLHRTEQNQPVSSGASLTRLSDGSDSFSLDFDSSGRAHPACSGSCINVTADQTLLIAIESEGYIHEG